MSNPQEGKSNFSKKITIARWSDRFFAWLIDYILVWTGTFAIFLIIIGISNYQEILENNLVIERTVDWAPISVVFFVYWILMENWKGRSIGKIVLGLKVTNMNGQKVSLKNIIISSFGKSFILPIDVVLGWIFTNKKRQRIFNKLSNTIVIKLETSEKSSSNIEYEMD